MITIPFELVDLNKFINEQRKYRLAGNRMKREQTNLCSLYVKRAMANGLSIDDSQLPVIIHFKWVMKNKRKDKDNIAFAKKFILDAFVESGLLPNDGWREIAGFVDDFEVDKNNPRVEVEIC